MTRLVNQSVRIGNVFLFLAVACSSLFTETLKAQQKGSYDSLLIYEAEIIEISDEKPKAEILSIFPVQQFNQKEIEQLSVNNVAEAVKFMPGVMIKDYGGIGGLKTISVRSLSASHTSVFIDGIKFSNSQSGHIDLGRFSTDRLSEIEVHSSGISSDLNLPAQAYLTSSSLYLQTQGAEFKGLDQSVAIDSKVSFGSFGYKEFQLGGRWQPLESVRLSMNIDRTDATGEYDYDFQNGSITESLRRKNTDIEATRVESDLKFKAGEDSYLNIKGYGYFSERGLPGAVIVGYYDKSKERLWNDDAFLQSLWSSKAFSTLNYVVRAKYAYSHTRYLNPVYFAGALDNRYTEHEAYTSFSLSQKLNNYFSLSSSSDISWNTMQSAQFSDSPERFSLLTVAALKIMFADLELNGSLLLSEVEEKSFDEAVVRNRSDLLPSLSIGYWMTNEVHTAVSYKQSLRLPSFNEMYFPRYGNTNIRPEYTTQYNIKLGYQRRFHGYLESLSLNGDLFRLKIRDKIISMPRGSLFNWSVMNLNRVETTGFELNGQITLNLPGPLKASFSGAFTYQEALEKTPSSSPYFQESTYGKQIAYTPKTTGSIISSLYYNNLSLSWQMASVGERFVSGEQTIQNYMPGYSTHDFNMIYKFKVFSMKSTFKAELKNAFDMRYEVIKSYPMPGRSVRVSFSVHS